MWRFGEDLDGYRVEEKVGADEVAVYLRAAALGRGGGSRTVLLSALHPHVSGQSALVEAFASPSKRGLGVDDPRLLSVESLSTIGDRKYRASPFLRGWCWSSLLEHVPRHEPTLTVSACFWIAFQMASAVAAGRRAGEYVHGSLGPEVLYLLPDFSIRIAPAVLDASGLERGRDAAFIAPELLAGEAPRPTSDVYGIAHLLWHALGVVTLREDSSTAAELTERHPALCEALLPALSAEPRERPADAAEFARLLGDSAPVHVGAGHLARFMARLGEAPPHIVGVPVVREVPTTVHADRASAPVAESDAATGQSALPGAAREGRATPKLRLVNGATGRELSLRGSASRWVVGRGRGADLVLEDADASREHFEVVRTSEATFCVYDLGSKNGLCVNGREVDEHALRPGDELRAGNTILRFEW